MKGVGLDGGWGVVVVCVYVCVCVGGAGGGGVAGHAYLFGGWAKPWTGLARPEQCWTIRQGNPST